MTDTQTSTAARRLIVCTAACGAMLVLATAGVNMPYDAEQTAETLARMNAQELLSYAVVALAGGLVVVTTAGLGLMLNVIQANTRALERFTSMSVGGACPLGRSRGRGE